MVVYMKIGSLCTGYGGLDMAVEAYFNAETVWCAEIDKYASKIIADRFNITNYGDIKSINWNEVEPIDILTAGYPCQPFSIAGDRKGENDPRHIWPNIKEIISILRPRIVILENVKGHLTLGFNEVLKGLTQIGYDARWEIVRASQVGAPHHRARIFVIAYPSGERCKDQLCTEKSSGIKQDITGDSKHFSWQHNRQVSELGRRFTSRSEMSLQDPPHALVDGKVNANFVEYMMGLPVGWVTDLDLSRSQQLKILGNGVVPQQAYHALEILCDVSHISYNETKLANAHSPT